MLELGLTENQKQENELNEANSAASREAVAPAPVELPPPAAENAPRFNASPAAETTTENGSANFLKNYELKGWSFTPYLYKVLAASLAINLLFIAVVAQGDLLRSRACDSPFVGKVCQVLDTVYIGSVLLGTDTEYTSTDYQKTMIEDSDNVIFNNLSGTDPVVYPEGYFALANPEQYQVISETEQITGIPNSSFPYVAPPTGGFSNPTIKPLPPPPTVKNYPMPKSSGINPIAPPMNGGMLSKKPKYPSGGKNPIANLPDSIDDTTADATKPDDEKKTTGGKDKTVSKTEPNVAQNGNNVKSAPVEEDKGFNKKPLEDFGVKSGESILKKEIDINAPFEIEVATKLDENGKFIKPVMKAKEGSDKKMTELAKEAVSVFSDSKLLKPLYDVGGRDLIIKFAQDKDNLQVIILTKTESATRAESLSSLLGLFLKNKPPKEGSDEAELFSKIQRATQDKYFIINFAMPNDEKSAMILKNLQKLQEKAKNQSNKSAENENSSQIAAGK